MLTVALKSGGVGVPGGCQGSRRPRLDEAGQNLGLGNAASFFSGFEV